MPSPSNSSKPRYLIADADEMEPGAFKDRILMEGNPHQLIEGLIICAYTVDTEIGYIFIRSEYTLAAKRIKKAIGEAYEKGYLGFNILGSGFNFELRLHVSSGRYICGEVRHWPILLKAIGLFHDTKRPVRQSRAFGACQHC